MGGVGRGTWKNDRNFHLEKKRVLLCQKKGFVHHLQFFLMQSAEYGNEDERIMTIIDECKSI
jgi:hypothetical protein